MISYVVQADSGCQTFTFRRICNAMIPMIVPPTVLTLNAMIRVVSAIDLSMKMGKTSQYIRQKLEKDPPPFKPDWMINVILSWNLGGNTVKYEFKNTQSAPSVTEFRGGGGKQQLRNTLTYQLLDRLQDYADVKQAELDTIEQLRTYDETERQVVQEVVEAFYNYRAAVARLKSASKGLDYQNRRGR